MKQFPSSLPQSALVGFCMFAFLLGAEPRVRASARNTETVATAGHRIVHEIEQRDFVAFDRDVSADGLLIVRREPDWSQSNVLLKDRPVSFGPQGGTGYLSFRGMKTVVWKEYEVSFAKPDLRNPSYLSLLTQLRGLVLKSQHNYHNLATSTETEDGFWFYERRLGPTIFGKIASDECLYVYLKREHSKWKVWRLELWERGAYQYDQQSNVSKKSGRTKK